MGASQSKRESRTKAVPNGGGDRKDHQSAPGPSNPQSSAHRPCSTESPAALAVTRLSSAASPNTNGVCISRWISSNISVSGARTYDAPRSLAASVSMAPHRRQCSTYQLSSFWWHCEVTVTASASKRRKSALAEATRAAQVSPSRAADAGGAERGPLLHAWHVGDPGGAPHNRKLKRGKQRWEQVQRCCKDNDRVEERRR